MYLNGIIAFDQQCDPYCGHPPSYDDSDASGLWDNGSGGEWDDSLSPSIAIFWTNMMNENCCTSEYCIREGGEVEGSFVLFMKNFPFYDPVEDTCDYDNLLTYEVMMLYC